ncbi:class I SAM-dependent methyltransferase [Membranihabitans marinus]|uniref:class I SAM-dependent methyltransferase n=1 Tax=Membranihabitans marinus TaxID=1227546 RepID=UPI001F3CBA77|nr:class I SAM-dependent methyltransferase [Membranihabitans marinus]
MLKLLKAKAFAKKHVRRYREGRNVFTHPVFVDTKAKTEKELSKGPQRSDIINFLLSQINGPTTYLEIGVCDPANNFDLIVADKKYSVDPGLEFFENPVDFKITSDEFFAQLGENKILSSDIQFDLIFIDGLHLAAQVDRDITNALPYLSEDGFIVLHDCNPPTEWHARENHLYRLTPARNFWNGTTWKAFLKWRSSHLVHSCCIDSDWGVGVLSKKRNFGGLSPIHNEFYEYGWFDQHRVQSLNLISFREFKEFF